MGTTRDWARSFEIPVEPNPPIVEGYSKRFPRSARQIALRTLILQGVVAVAAQVDPKPIIEWFHEQRLWRSVTADENAFLQNNSPTQEQRNKFAWHQEAEWTLLWVIGKVEALGLPTRACDSRRLCDEIMPPLGSDITKFVASAQLRPPGLLLAEDHRTYNLWCFATRANLKGQPLPEDLDLMVLSERRYAFEWLDGMQEWDHVTCDS